MEAKQCQCGAVTVTGEGFNNSMYYSTFRKEFPGVRLSRKNKFCNCNHCVNHWGIDLCGCGSGEKVGKCSNEYTECVNSIPAQHKGEEKVYSLWR
jgi:hypothetical protein